MSWLRWSAGLTLGTGSPGPIDKRPRRSIRRASVRIRRALAVLSAHGLVASGLAPVAVVAVGAVAITATGWAVSHAPARASISGSVLILGSSVNGGTGSAEANAASALGLSLTVATDTQWPTENFANFNAIIIGDPSSSSCSTSVPPEALSTVSTWQPTVTGNVAVLGTAPALAGSSGTALITDAIAYAASAYNSQNHTGTGLYVSLNCEDSGDSAGTPVGGTGSAKNWLNGIEGIGTAGGLTDSGQGSACPNGTVNTQEAVATPGFSGKANPALSGWPSPACPVQESLSSWPASFTPVAYDAAATPANFTASNGVSGQPFVLLGAPVSGSTAGLAASQGGQVPPGSAVGGSNPAAPGVSQAMADPVNTENGDFTQMSNDLTIPTFGPALQFSRTYDAALAQQEAITASPKPAGALGSMGYGWTDNWDTSLSANKSVLPGDIYTIDGLATATGNGGSATAAALNSPASVSVSGSDVYIADTAGNRIEEIPAASGTQWGISMTAGNMYTIVGSDTGQAGGCANGTAMAACKLTAPQGVTVDSAGNLFIADTGKNRVLEIPVANGTNYGIPMTHLDVYTVAGNWGGSGGHSGDGGAASQAFLFGPAQVVLGPSGDTSLYIADAGNNRVQEVFQTGGQKWGQTMSNNDIYTVAGQADGTGGNNGAGGPATMAKLANPESISISSGGDLYIAVTGNNKVQEVAQSSGSQWNSQSMTANDIYNVAGDPSGGSGRSANGTVNTSTLLFNPTGIVVNNGTQMYITDALNNRVAEIARTTHTEWNISMTANDLYNIAGSAQGTSGYTGNGGLATAATMSLGNGAGKVGYSSAGIYVADTANNEIRLVSSSNYKITDFAGGAGTFGQDGNGGIAVSAGLRTPMGVASDRHGDIFVADAGGNRVQEIAVYNHIQFGVTMTAGNVYTVAGSPGGYHGGGPCGTGNPVTAALLCQPGAVAVDLAGNLYIADTFDNRVQKMAPDGTITTFAGQADGTGGNSGQGGPAAQAKLTTPQAVATDAAGDVFITTNNQVLEVPAAAGTYYGVSMPAAGDVYTVAGSADGTPGNTGDLGKGYSSKLDNPVGLAVDSSGNIYIGDYSSNRVRELAAVTHTQWGVKMFQQDIYTVAGPSSSQCTPSPPSCPGGASGDGGPATAARLGGPQQIAIDSWGNLYIADSGNDKIREIAAASGTQWGQDMTGGNIYTVAGTGSPGSTVDGVPATASPLDAPPGIGVDPAGDLFVTNSVVGSTTANRLQEIPATATPLFATDPLAATTWDTSGITITQPGGSQVTFYPKNSGSCVTPYVAAGTGGYCSLPQYVAANLTYSGANGGQYTYTPSPGLSYVYGSSGALYSETDMAGNTLSVAYSTPLPGGTNCPTWVNTCNTITAANGRAMVIGYNATGMVREFTDPMGRQWDYTYTGSDLATVKDPMLNITSFSYDSGNASPLLDHDLLTVTSPNGQTSGKSSVNTYDPLGRVSSQTDPMGFTTTFSYCVNAAAGACMNESLGTGYTNVTDPDGNTAVYGYTGGTLTSQAAWTGNVGATLKSEQDYAPIQATGVADAGTQLDTATADGNGSVTQFSYDPSGNATVTTDPLGNSTTQATPAGQDQPACDGTPLASGTSSCAQNVGPAPVAPGGVITPPSAAPPVGLTYILYDNDGNELYATSGVYEPGSNNAAYSQTTYQLYKNNSVTLPGASNAITCANNNPPSPSLPCARVNADGVVTQLGYDAQGDLVSSSAPDGNGSEVAVTTYAYNGDGRQTSITSPDGNLSGANAANYATTTAYNADQDRSSVTQAGGTGATVTPRTTNYGYDANGNQTTVQDARGYTTTTTYNADDQATVVADPDNNSTLTCYDGAGHVTETVPPVGVAANNLNASSCPSSYPSGYGNRLASDATTYKFDALGHDIQETTPAPAGQTGSEVTTYSYDGAGNLTMTTAPPTSSGGPNQVTADAYNSLGELTSETTGSGTTAAASISYCYDPNGNLTAVVYPDGNAQSGTAPCETSSPWIIDKNSYPTQAQYQTTSSYDSAQELVATTAPATTAAPSGATTTSTYDPAGNMLTRTDPNGITTTWTYTPLNKSATVTYSGSSAHSVSYGYDANGMKTAMTDATGSSSYVYDPFGELTSATNGASQATGYGYNPDGEVASISYPLPASATWATSSTVSYAYDNADLLTAVTDFNGHQISIGSTADGLPNSVGLGSSGDTITTSYDNTDNPSAISLKNGTNTLQSFTYADSPASTILSEADTPNSAQSPAAYTYDAKGRVTSMTPGTNPTLSYGFDASSNLTTLPPGGTGHYDNAGELSSATQSGTTTSYTYDADGQRLTAKQGATTVASASWNGPGQLTAYSDPAASMAAVTYDGSGLRASATFTPSGGSPVTQQYVWNGTSLLTDGTNVYIYTDGPTPVEQVNETAGTITYLVADSLGSIRGTVNSSGVLAGTTSYDAWGNPQTAGGLSGTSPFGYAGSYVDPTGIEYLIHRYYDSVTGQFISVDPAIMGTAQPYQYAFGNPVDNNDPTGLYGGWTGIWNGPRWVSWYYRTRFCLDLVIGKFCPWVSEALVLQLVILFLDHRLTERIVADAGWTGGAVGAGSAAAARVTETLAGWAADTSAVAFYLTALMYRMDRAGHDHGVQIWLYRGRIRIHYRRIPILGTGYLFPWGWFWLPGAGVLPQ